MKSTGSPRYASAEDAIEQRGETPDLAGIGREIAQNSSEHSDTGKQRQGKIFVIYDGGRERNEDARDQTGDIAAENPGQQAPFESEIDRLINLRDHAHADSGAENGREPEGEIEFAGSGSARPAGEPGVMHQRAPGCWQARRRPPALPAESQVVGRASSG